jgi:uncharacterized protein
MIMKKPGLRKKGKIKMSDKIDKDSEERQEILKKIIKELHKGAPIEQLQETFAKLIQRTSPEEIAAMENALIQEGFPVEDIQRLCDVHAKVFKASLEKVGKPSKIPGHPVYTFIEENKEAAKILDELKKIAKTFKKNRASDEDISQFKEIFSRLKEIEKHYARKENQLFPALEAKGFTGPTKVMWGKHDEIRDALKNVHSILNSEKWDELYKAFKDAASKISKMIFLEEKILYPTSMKKLTDSQWAQIKRGDSEIGYAWVKPSNLWDANLAEAKSLQAAPEMKGYEPDANSIRLSEGSLTREQIDLMLTSLPVDVTFVDANDKVCFYSAQKERIFPRSPGIIGRAVQNCHPPKSIDIVNDIIKAFREKKKNSADFWIQMNEKFIYIRYFPVYDDKGEYKGVIEVTQDITEIKKLEGQRRLLDW